MFKCEFERLRVTGTFPLKAVLTSYCRISGEEETHDGFVYSHNCVGEEAKTFVNMKLVKIGPQVLYTKG